jgi:hypothetical protein
MQAAEAVLLWIAESKVMQAVLKIFVVTAALKALMLRDLQDCCCVYPCL